MVWAWRFSKDRKIGINETIFICPTGSKEQKNTPVAGCFSSR
jgi:hypothetical protein